MVSPALAEENTLEETTKQTVVTDSYYEKVYCKGWLYMFTNSMLFCISRARDQ